MSPALDTFWAMPPQRNRALYHKTFMENCATDPALAGDICIVCRQQLGDEYSEYTIKNLSDSKVGNLHFHKEPPCFDPGSDILARQLRGRVKKFVQVRTRAGGREYEYNMQPTAEGRLELIIIQSHPKFGMVPETKALKMLRDIYSDDKLVMLSTRHASKENGLLMLAHVSDKIFSSHLEACPRDTPRLGELRQDLEIRGKDPLEEAEILGDFARELVCLVDGEPGR
ncbi:hypothetical protein CENSYa_0568 [Cenarchaeum symbiosum A]|uniref:Uncharacterized protein n=1 Tax=Cenarchaeum symbiosum (strain A) TaxID=414004 RepID=A0RV34_CENSY|nr:hypothetical protein CENSYa_0568 [Cenarchaeum symbiosum A]